MSTLSTLYRGETTIGFVGQARRWFIVSGVALVLCLASLAIQRLNLSLDFTGGTASSCRTRPERVWGRSARRSAPPAAQPESS